MSDEPIEFLLPRHGQTYFEKDGTKYVRLCGGGAWSTIHTNHIHSPTHTLTHVYRSNCTPELFCARAHKQTNTHTHTTLHAYSCSLREQLCKPLLLPIKSAALRKQEELLAAGRLQATVQEEEEKEEPQLQSPVEDGDTEHEPDVMTF